MILSLRKKTKKNNTPSPSEIKTIDYNKTIQTNYTLTFKQLIIQKKYLQDIYITGRQLLYSDK